MNSDVNPEVEMFNRVAALMGTTLTEADVHRFLLEAAEFLGEGSLSMYGPNVFFRWQLGERVIEIEPGYRPWGEEYSVTVDSYNRGFPIDTQERLIYKYGDADLYPYLWRVDLGDEVTDWWGPGEAYVVNWELFEETTAKTLGGLPTDMALMPPQWRRPFTFRWDMGESGLGLVSFTGTVDGLMVTAETTGDQVLIPRDLLRSEGGQINMRDVVAGLAGGRPLIDIRFAGSEGFGDANHQELYVATPNGNESGWDKAIVESLIQEHKENDSRPAMTMEDLRQLAATPAAAPSDATVDEPEQSQTRWTTVPMKIGLSIPAVLHVVEQIVTGTAMEDVLTRLGGQPGSRWDEPILRGDGWLASPSGGKWEIEVVTDPEEDEGENLCFDERHLADYAWRIAQALEQRYGPPYGMHTTNDGFLSRLFQVGDHGVTVRGGLGAVTVKIGSFETLAQYC